MRNTHQTLVGVLYSLIGMDKKTGSRKVVALHAANLTEKWSACYNYPGMATERNTPLDTSALHAAYPSQELPPHEHFGNGLRYRFGRTHADVYGDPPEVAPVIQVRMAGGYLAVGEVLHVLPTEAGGLHIDHANGACEIEKTGDVMLVYTAPRPKPLLRTSPTGLTRKVVFGREYTQTSLEIEGTPEGVRVEIHGMVAAAPRPVNSKRGSPLQFALGEVDPQGKKETVWHEVWAANKVGQELKALKLKKDDVLDAVLYRHSWVVELQGGRKETHTRHNLATIIKVVRKDDAKRFTKAQAATSEKE